MTLSPMRFALMAGFAMLPACRAVPPPVSTPAPAPAPAPVPVAAPAPAPGPVAQRPDQSWDVAPVGRGDWSYRKEGADSLASFADGGAPRVIFRCRAAARQISLGVSSSPATARAITLRTSYGVLNWQAVAGAEGVVATRAAGDQGFDWIAYSRGRIGIEIDGRTPLVLPIGTEISRVVEDCRN